jgi:hypothetical protein
LPVTAAVAIQQRGVLRAHHRDAVTIVVDAVVIIVVLSPPTLPEPLLAVLPALLVPFALAAKATALRLAEFSGRSFGGGQGRDGCRPANRCHDSSQRLGRACDE